MVHGSRSLQGSPVLIVGLQATVPSAPRVQTLVTHSVSAHTVGVPGMQTPPWQVPTAHGSTGVHATLPSTGTYSHRPPVQLAKWHGTGSQSAGSKHAGAAMQPVSEQISPAAHCVMSSRWTHVPSS
jgi:hypothetical protein